MDKWTGIKELLLELNLKENQVCCVGDELNDLPMISASHHGFAMGNADSRLKAKAKYTCGDYDKNGILDVLAYIEHTNLRSTSK